MGILDKGWVLIGGAHESAFKLLARWRIKGRNPDVKISHYPGGEYGFDMGTREITVEIYDIHFPTKEDAEACIECLDILNAIPGGYNLELQVHSDNSKFKLNGGTSTVMKVLKTGFVNMEKLADGDTQIYKIASINFEQCG